MATIRKAISKKTRFEVFKRDAFTCAYCGSHPPSIVLHVDHIQPVALGGGNHMDNLVTSCESCNLGKSANSLLDIPQSLVDKAAEVKEREEQIKGYQKVMDSKRSRLVDEVDGIVDIYRRFNPGFTLTDAAQVSVKTFIEKLGKHEVEDAMERAMSKPSRGNGSNFKYFCGICWNKIREAK